MRLLQNSLQDLYGILSFLRVEPLDNKAIFSRTIQRPIRAGDPQGIMRLQVQPQGCACIFAPLDCPLLDVRDRLHRCFVYEPGHVLCPVTWSEVFSQLCLLLPCTMLRIRR